MKRTSVKLDGHPIEIDVEWLKKEEDLDLFEDRVWPFEMKSMFITRPTVDQMMELDLAKIDGVNKTKAAEQISRMNSGDTDWYGGTAKDMRDRRLGWREGVDKMLEMIEKIVPEYGHAKRPRPTYMVEGYQVSVERVLDGHDKPWLGRRRRWGPRSLTISVEYGQHCGHSAESLYMRGAAAVAAIDTLEDMGYRIELYAVNCVKGVFQENENMGTMVEVEVKRAQDPVDLDYLASTMCSPLFFRGNCFALWEAIPMKVVSHLGCPRDVPEAYRKEVHVSELPENATQARELYQEIVDRAIKSQVMLDNVS